MRVSVLLCLFAGVGAAQPDQPAGSVSGRVTVRGSGAPVRGAVVVATQSSRGSGVAWTGADGRFRIEELASGLHNIAVIKPALGVANRFAEVKAREETRGIDLAIAPPGVVAGNVHDREGLPVEGARIILQSRYWHRGRPHLSIQDTRNTDDRGKFRAWPPPSSYFVALQPPSHPGLAGRYRLLHPPLFYPNALNPAAAQLVVWRPGTQAVDFEVPEPADTVVQVSALAGKVGETPRACTRCTFRVAVRNGLSWLEVLSGEADSQGLIEIRGLHPGSYRIAFGRGLGTDVYAGYVDTVAEEGKSRKETATAWAANPTPVRLTLVDPPEELLSADRSWTVRLTAGLLEPLYPSFARNSRTVIEGKGASAAGRLALHPGMWALDVYGPEVQDGKAYIERISLAGQPQRSPFVRVNARGSAPPIEIRVGFATGAIAGTVSGMPPFEPGQHRTRGFVHAVPDPGDGYGSRLEVTTRRNSEFEISRAAPGGYILFAVGPNAGEPRLDFADPAVQARYASYAKRVRLESGETVHVELEAIP